MVAAEDCTAKPVDIIVDHIDRQTINLADNFFYEIENGFKTKNQTKKAVRSKEANGELHFL